MSPPIGSLSRCYAAITNKSDWSESDWSNLISRKFIQRLPFSKFFLWTITQMEPKAPRKLIWVQLIRMLNLWPCQIFTIKHLNTVQLHDYPVVANHQELLINSKYALINPPGSLLMVVCLIWPLIRSPMTPHVVLLSPCASRAKWLQRDSQCFLLSFILRPNVFL